MSLSDYHIGNHMYQLKLRKETMTLESEIIISFRGLRPYVPTTTVVELSEIFHDYLENLNAQTPEVAVLKLGALRAKIQKIGVRPKELSKRRWNNPYP